MKRCERNGGKAFSAIPVRVYGKSGNYARKELDFSSVKW
jgi:hypothetical protein